MLRKLTLVLTVSAMGLVLAMPGASANPAPSREREESSREQTLRRIHNLLDQEVVRDRLAKMGIERQELENRLEKLDDQELQQLSHRLDSVGVGGDGLGLVVVLLVIAALVLLVVYLVQHT